MIITSNYSFKVKYISYKNHSGSEITEMSEGYYKRSGIKYVTNAVGITTIQNEKIRMVIDTSEKLIAVTSPGTYSPNIQSSEDLIKLLENVKSLRKKANDKSILYRIDFKKNDLYEAYEFTINVDGLLEKLSYYYSEQTEKDYGDGESKKPSEYKIKPRLDITFMNYMIPAKTTDADFMDKSIVLAANNKISLLNKYKSYQLKDYRLQGKK